MRWVVVFVLGALGCGSPQPPTAPDGLVGEATTDSGILHPETNGQTCAQCHTGTRRSLNGS